MVSPLQALCYGWQKVKYRDQPDSDSDPEHSEIPSEIDTNISNRRQRGKNSDSGQMDSHVKTNRQTDSDADGNILQEGDKYIECVKELVDTGADVASLLQHASVYGCVDWVDFIVKL